MPLLPFIEQDRLRRALEIAKTALPDEARLGLGLGLGIGLGLGLGLEPPRRLGEPIP